MKARREEVLALRDPAVPKPVAFASSPVPCGSELDSIFGELVRELAQRVDEPTGGTLEASLDAGRAVIALTVDDRERILRALEDCPAGLAELRGVLLRDHEWRVREGLI